MSKIQQRRDQLKSLWSATQWNDIATYIGPNAEKFKPAWEKQRDAILTKGYGIT